MMTSWFVRFMKYFVQRPGNCSAYASRRPDHPAIPSAGGTPAIVAAQLVSRVRITPIPRSTWNPDTIPCAGSE
jgi:hypothetical protein